MTPAPALDLTTSLRGDSRLRHTKEHSPFQTSPGPNFPLPQRVMSREGVKWIRGAFMPLCTKSPFD